jgi:hypothetical protein
VPKPKAPPWLTLAFAEGVTELELRSTRFPAAYPGAYGRCWLAQHDERRRPCSGPLERAHLISRQRVEHALGALLPDRWELINQMEAQMGEPDFWSGNYAATVAKAHGELIGSSLLHPLADLILLAAWDPRNAVIGCSGEHHPRFDSHATPPLVVPQSALPAHVFEFADDFGLETALNDRFPLYPDRVGED